MKVHIISSLFALMLANGAIAQKTDAQVETKVHTKIVSNEVQVKRVKQDAKFAKEQKKLRKRQNKLAKKQKKFDKQQTKLAKAERKLAHERAKRDRYLSKLDKETILYSRRMTDGKMSTEEIAKWQLEKQKYEKNVAKSIKRMQDADEKVRSLRN